MSTFEIDDRIVRNPSVPEEIFKALGLDPDGEYVVLEVLIVEGTEGVRLTPKEGALTDYFPSRFFVKKVVH